MPLGKREEGATDLRVKGIREIWGWSMHLRPVFVQNEQGLPPMHCAPPTG
jgi:hypothetical protein